MLVRSRRKFRGLLVWGSGMGRGIATDLILGLLAFATVVCRSAKVC